jgi:hypothetical protein
LNSVIIQPDGDTDRGDIANPLSQFCRSNLARRSGMRESLLLDDSPRRGKNQLSQTHCDAPDNDPVWIQ